MSVNKVYSTNIWDYLRDIPYMPSRRDRDQLIQAGEEKRVLIWNYFFQIIPAHIGKPQKGEIESINKRLFEKISQYKRVQQEISNRIVV